MFFKQSVAPNAKEVDAAIKWNLKILVGESEYKAFSFVTELEVVFQCRKTGLQYKNAEEYLANAASEDGDIIYFLR